MLLCGSRGKNNCLCTPRIKQFLPPEEESSRTSLASRVFSRTHFEVLGLDGQDFGLGLEASSSRKLPCSWLHFWFLLYYYQRWSRGHKARGQEHKKNSRPRTAFPRTEPFEAKDRNAPGQGQRPRTQAQVFSKKKVSKKFFSGDLQFIGVIRNYERGRPKPQIT